MYLSQFHVKNFRCLQEIALKFKDGLNVLIGENNSGKTAIIDALRICLSLGSSRKEIFLHSDDFYIDKDGKKETRIEFDLTFSSLTDQEQGVFIELLSLASGQPELQLHIRYYLEDRNGIERIRIKYWGGDNEGQSIPSEVMELFYIVFLGALRDAERDLSPSRGNRLSQLFLKLVRDTEKQKEYAGNLESRINADDDWKKLLQDGKQKVNEHLKHITIEQDTQQVEIGFVPLEFKRIVENLKMQLPYGSTHGDGQLRFEIDQNGLGYNNLIYIATVLGDVVERKRIEKQTYIALLIEEPEAHLHPQLQDILFNFLTTIATYGIQLFVTSHSPTVTAKSTIDSLMVLETADKKISSVALRECPLTDENKKYLERFLDVTKSQLFFARAIILVEGISEALLLPSFAEIMGVGIDKNAIEIVNIGGTAFEPFARLFNSQYQNNRLGMRCCILSDDDRDRTGAISARAENAKALEGGQLRVYLAERTFEFELFQAGNSQIMISTYLALHPKTEIKTVDDFVNKIKENKDKAVFAQTLASRLREDKAVRAGFTVPQYIQDAINWAVGHDA